MRAKTLTFAALALTAGLSLTACQGGGSSAASTNDPGAASSSSAGNSSDGTTPDSTASGSATSGGKTTHSGDGSTSSESAGGSGKGQTAAGACKTANLDFSVTHGMGEGDLLVSLKNTGDDACSLKGFPGVDLRSQDASGPLSAERSDLAAPAVSVSPGESTRFTLHYPPNNTGGTGVYVSAIEVTPPDETHSKALSVSISLPVSADTGPKVRVDPVGTGKQ
ncbi:DUF4232 domain-containing protein [Streptomyces sp. NPDC056796]|uniref:DUF4232 domain-containing protein n=1 Tax=Streptomyces sp. NPDC056796 TaxID=3345947 RepID=UPI0036A523EC